MAILPTALPLWPIETLPPARAPAQPAAFTRTGGRSLGAIEVTTRTDRGFWRITLESVPVAGVERNRSWNAIRTLLGGKAGVIAVPVLSMASSPYVSGEFEAATETPHDDDTFFDDDTGYDEGAIYVETAEAAPLGALTMKLRLFEGAEDLSGVRFSHQHAFYETGRALDTTGDVWTVEIFPSVRRAIPAGEALEFDRPTCLCHMEDDRGMDIAEGIEPVERMSVAFVEAVDVWNALAAEDAA